MGTDNADRSQTPTDSILAGTYPTYKPFRPGDPSLDCPTDACSAWCCRSLTVPADDHDVSAIAEHQTLPQARFLESEGGFPIELPLAHPYVMARSEGACVFLDKDHLCNVYEARPSACRSYPFELLVVESASGRELPVSEEAVLRALGPGETESLNGESAVLMRHRECPGFTGEPMTEAAWESVALKLVQTRSERGR